MKTWGGEESRWLRRNLKYNSKYPFPDPPGLVKCLDNLLTSLLEDNIQVWTMQSQSGNTQVHTLLDKIDAASDQPLPAVLRASTSLKSPTLYIFTSGTTGESVVFYISNSFRTVNTNNLHVFTKMSILLVVYIV